MTPPLFIRLNIDWNAEPNTPFPEISTDDSELQLRILTSSPRLRGEECEVLRLTFEGCRAWRLSDLNDEGWYRGQCRYGKLAPRWGDFYEITGDDSLRDQPNDWQSMPMPGAGSRHYLFYLRDETFECIAGGWTIESIKAMPEVSNISRDLVGIEGVEYLS